MLRRLFLSHRVRRVFAWIFALACLTTLVWAGIATWQRPCRQAKGEAGLSDIPCPSLTLDIVVVAVGVGLWIIALRAAYAEQWPSFLSFLIAAGTLGTGLLSTTGSDWGSRFFYPMLAFCSPALFSLHYELISRPPARLLRATRWVFVSLAIIGSLPSFLWSRPTLEQLVWSPFWRGGVRVLLLLSTVTSTVMVAWYARHDWPEAKRRPIRLIAFGNVAAAVPLMFLSLIPSILAFPIKVPWEISFLGLLASPLLYSYALKPIQPPRLGLVLKRAFVYYLLFVSFGFFFLSGVAIARHLLGNLQRDWPWLGILLGAGCMVTTGPLSQLFEHLTDLVWFGSKANYARVVGQLAESLAITLDRAELQRLLVHELAQKMHVSWSALFLRNREQELTLSSSNGLEVTAEVGLALPRTGRLTSYLRTCNTPIPHEHVRKALADAPLSQEERWWLSLSDLAFWIPLRAEGTLQGVLLIGPKTSGDVFTIEDERILTTLAYQAGIAAHNVLLGEEKAAIETALVQAQKMEAIGRLAAGIAHDFNNILTSIIGYAQLLQRQEGMPQQAMEDLKIIVAEGERAAHLVRQILDFSRKSIIQRRPLDLFPFLKESIKFLQRTIPENIHISLEIDGNSDCDYTVSSDPAMMRQVVANLAANAYDAMPDGGELRFRLSRLTLKPGDPAPLTDMQPGEWVALSVVDTGVGISKEDLPHLFEPFFTTKEVGKGTGLGLAQVYGIVKQHEGHIAVKSEQGKGTTFTIYLPALSGPKAPREGNTEKMRRGRGETILVVEDERVVLEAIRGMLEQANYHVLAASNVYEALDLYDQHQGEIALVLTDMVMPGLGGKDLIQILRARDPKIRIIAMSGYPLKERGFSLLGEETVEWITKPVTMAQLSRIVNRALNGA